MAKPATNKKARKISPPASGKSSAAAAERRPMRRGRWRRRAPVSHRGQALGRVRRRASPPRHLLALVLHLISRSEGGASYGNQLIEEIEALTRGIVSVNPNTMYPLLRASSSHVIS